MEQVTVEKVVELLKEKNLRFACAESCTGGAFSKCMTSVPGSSKVFECGIVCYSNDVKYTLLGVTGSLLKKMGAVNELVSIEMAQGVRLTARAKLALSITGIAGPDTDEFDRPVGLIYLTVTDGYRSVTKRLETGDSAEGCRERNQARAIEAALELIVEYVQRM